MQIGLYAKLIEDPRVDICLCWESVAISWSSKKQAIVALSSIEVEYRGAAITTCEEVWIRSLLADLGEYIDGVVTIWCDNMSNIQLAKNPVFHAMTKHFEVHYPFVRAKVIDGKVDNVVCEYKSASCRNSYKGTKHRKT